MKPQPKTSEFLYYVHGFTLESEIECPELLPGACTTPDVHLRRGSLEHLSLDEPRPGKSRCIGEMHILLNIENVGRISIFDGREIIVDPFAGVEPKLLRQFLLGSTFGCLIHQRGLLALHANAFLHRGEAVLVLAHSGTGKSTLAAAMKERGCAVLADDVCAVHAAPGEAPLIYPGVPQIKLWRDAAERLGKDVDSMRRIANNEEKYAMPVLAHDYGPVLRIKALYILNTHDGEELNITDMNRLEKIHALEDYTYRKGMVSKLGIEGEHRKSRAALMDSVRIRRIFRPQKGFLLDELVELLEADLR